VNVPDVFSKKKRSWIMAQVHSAGTRLELRVQTALDALGVPYSIDSKAIPGKPDIVIKSMKLAVFANGCFWHWHGCKRSRMPASNREYWEAKIERNMRRDRRTRRLLWAQGWHCCNIWECEVERGVRRMLAKIAALRRSGTRPRK
jgi:DNA mismatch endonuclease (patch repair protein)